MKSLYRVQIYDTFIHVFKDNKYFSSPKISMSGIHKGVRAYVSPDSDFIQYDYTLLLGMLGFPRRQDVIVNDYRTSIK